MLYRQLGVLFQSKDLAACKPLCIICHLHTAVVCINSSQCRPHSGMFFCLKIVYVFKHSGLVLPHFCLTQGCVFKSLKGLALLHKMSQQSFAVIKRSSSSPLLSFIINCSDLRVYLIVCNLHLIEISENYEFFLLGDKAEFVYFAITYVPELVLR